LNGHIHQVARKVEGNMTFHTARSTGFPQPAPCRAPAPDPFKDVPAEKLRSMLGPTRVEYVAGRGPLAVVDAASGGLDIDGRRVGLPVSDAMDRRGDRRGRSYRSLDGYP
jgi:hypothetical protein